MTRFEGHEKNAPLEEGSYLDLKDALPFDLSKDYRELTKQLPFASYQWINVPLLFVLATTTPTGSLGSRYVFSRTNLALVAFRYGSKSDIIQEWISVSRAT